MNNFLRSLETFEFAHWWWLALLLLLPLVGFLLGRKGPVTTITFSSVSLVREVCRDTRSRAGKYITFLLRYLSIAFLILGMARPRVEQGEQDSETEGIDIMLVLDFSYSMQEGKLSVDGEEYTYIKAMERITKEFVEKRPNDRLGVIGFAVQPYLISPLTSDHDWVMEMLDDAELDLGTAIGSAMVSGVRSLSLSDRVTRVMVVVTDGNNNIGISPLAAAKLSRRENIRIYPVEITSTQTLAPRRIAAHPLNNVAKISRGQFFQATDFDSLSLLYEHIEKLEKSFVKENKLTAYEEWFMYFVITGLLLLILEFVMRQTVYRRLP